MNAETLQNLIFYKYRYVLAYFAMITVSIGTLIYKLDSLLPGISATETAQGTAIIQDSTTILEKGIYLPYNLLQTLSVEILGESTLALRVPSVFIGFLMLIMMFILIHMWHKDKIAIASLFFLSTSSWFLTFARSGTPYIYMAFSLVLIFLSGTLLRHSEKPRAALVFTAIALPLALYAPYMIYILILFLYLYREEIREIVTSMQRSNLVVISIVGVTVALPLLYGFISDIGNLKDWLGIPATLPSISEYLSNMLRSVQHVLWTSQSNPEFHLANLPMLDIFTSTMAALGLYHYERHFNLLRTRFIIYGLGFSILLFGLSADETNYIVITPILYILGATGIVTLLAQWNKIFPINPFARTLALLPLAFAVLITSQYHLDKYFSAWALNPNVRSVYPTEPILLEAAIDSSESERILIITNQLEHDALSFLLNDSRLMKSIDLMNPNEGAKLSNLAAKYDQVFLDGNVTQGARTKLDNYISVTITSDKQSKPIAYRVYDLSTKVGSSEQY